MCPCAACCTRLLDRSWGSSILCCGNNSLNINESLFLCFVSLAMVMALVTWYLLLYIIVREASENHTALPKVLCCTRPPSSIWVPCMGDDLASACLFLPRLVLVIMRLWVYLMPILSHAEKLCIGSMYKPEARYLIRHPNNFKAVFQASVWRLYCNKSKWVPNENFMAIIRSNWWIFEGHGEPVIMIASPELVFPFQCF